MTGNIYRIHLAFIMILTVPDRALFSVKQLGFDARDTGSQVRFQKRENFFFMWPHSQLTD